MRHVIVEGDLLVEEGRLGRLDLAEIRRQAADSLESLLQRSGLEL